MHAAAVGNPKCHHVQLLGHEGKGLIMQGSKTEVLCLPGLSDGSLLFKTVSQDAQEMSISASIRGFRQEPCIYKELTLRR